MNAQTLLTLAVRVAAERTVQGVLHTIVEGCAAHSDVALARIWLASPGDICDSCFMRAECLDQTECFHLVASAGTPLQSPGEDWSFLDGHFRRMPVNARKVGKVGGSGTALLIRDVAAEPEHIARPEWAQREGIRSFAGYPLISGDRILGVLAIFTRALLEQQDFTWMKVFADQAAVAIANARALEARNRAEENLRNRERRLRLLTETIPEMLWSASPDGAVDYVNQYVVDYTGLSAEEIQGSGWMKAVHPDFANEMAEAWMSSVKSGSPFQFEFRGLHVSDETYRWCVSRALPLRDQAGRIVKWYGTVTDLEDWKRAQEGLRESEGELRQLIDGIPQLIWRANADGSMDYHNERLLAYHGRAMDEMRGWGFAEILHADDREKALKRRQEGFGAGKPFEFEARLLNREGQYRWFLIRGLPLRDSHGSIAKWYGTCTDIESRKQTEQALQLENAYLHEQVGRQFTGIVGQSPALKKVLQQIDMVAATDSSVLILGESGTGKELVARAIHDNSRRHDRHMVTVNCASIPRELFESEFFGHTKGSFTGALRDRVGRFQLADKGTIFLDEVAEIPVELQSKLLRVLQEGDLERIGEDHARHVDVRVIAATNRDLTQEVHAGRFRKDLYYRLCVFPIYLPPLRERREDIAQLAAHLMKTTSERLNFPKVRLTDQALELLCSYDWPGNIRELQNVLERAIIVTRSGPLRIDLVLGDTRNKMARAAVAAAASGQNALSTTPADRVLSVQELERREYANTLAALTKSNWKIYGPGGAAEILGTKPTTLASRIKRLGIKRPGS